MPRTHLSRLRRAGQPTPLPAVPSIAHVACLVGSGQLYFTAAVVLGNQISHNASEIVQVSVAFENC